MKKKVYIACDHAAFKEKAELVRFLNEDAHLHRIGEELEIIDLGTNSDARVNYPDYAVELCRRLLEHPERLEIDRGILLCGSGIGMSITANKFKGIRAALCRDTVEAELSRSHNDANVLCLGARTTNLPMLKEIVKIWFHTEFSGGRHADRLKIIAELGQ